MSELFSLQSQEEGQQFLVKKTEISFLHFSLHNMQQNYFMSNHIICRTAILPKYHLIYGGKGVPETDCFLFLIFAGANGVILDTKPRENVFLPFPPAAKG